MQRNSIKTQNQKLWYKSENACVCGGVIAQDKALWEKKIQPSKIPVVNFLLSMGPGLRYGLQPQ